MPCSDGHVGEGGCHVAVVQATHAHATGWLGSRKAHARQAMARRDAPGHFVGSGWPQASMC
jgi:hypothetical protein